MANMFMRMGFFAPHRRERLSTSTLRRQDMFENTLRREIPADILAGGRVARPTQVPTYLVHAAVMESELHATETDDILLHKLVRRRLVRLERVVSALSGRVVRQMPRSLLAAFESAEAAVYGACEMQRRCSVIPQISETQIALKIGIQRSAGFPREGDAVDPAEIAAINFASVLGEGSIVIADALLSELAPPLRAAASPLVIPDIEVAAHSINWQRVPMLRLPPPGARRFAPAKSNIASTAHASIVLVMGSERYSFGSDHPVITIGRDPVNDIVVDDPKTSRQHCRIIHQREGYVLVDVSTNGTFLTPEAGRQHLIRKAMLNLPVRGCISPGRTPGLEHPCILSFEVSSSD